MRTFGFQVETEDMPKMMANTLSFFEHCEHQEEIVLNKTLKLLNVKGTEVYVILKTGLSFVDNWIQTKGDLVEFEKSGYVSRNKMRSIYPHRTHPETDTAFR